MAAQWHEQLASSSRAAEAQLRAKEALLAGTMADREQWVKVTEDERYLAVTADAELRRRHPDEHLEPLRTASRSRLIPMRRYSTNHPSGQPRWNTSGGEFADRLAERQSQMVPDEDPDYEEVGRAYPSWEAAEHDAILQPPKPMIRPAPRVIEQVKEREAAD